MSTSSLTSAEYVQHHLSFFQLNLHTMKLTTNSKLFWVLNIDTLFMAILLGVIFLGLFYYMARKTKAGVPGKFQCVVEMIVEFVDRAVEETFHAPSRLIAPLAMTVFIWVFFDELC